MKITNKVHTGTAIAAAVLTILGTIGMVGSSVSTVITTLRYGSTGIGSYIASISGNIIGMILMIVALLRRKKDAVAGVLFIIQILLTLVTLFGNVRAIFLGYGSAQTIAALIRTLAMMICIGFYGLLTAESFSPGAISGSSVKILPVILPIIYIVLILVATVVQQIFGYGANADMTVLLVGVLMPAVVSLFGKVWMIILGLAFSIPVYEKPSFESIYNL